MGVKENAGSGELEEGELSSGNESGEIRVSWKTLKEEHARKLKSHDAVVKSRDSLRPTAHYEPTPPRGYRTPAGQRLRDKRRRRSPSHNLKFKYHGTIDLIRKSGGNYSQNTHVSPFPSPSRRPEHSENQNSDTANINHRPPKGAPQGIKELVAKKGLRKKAGILAVFCAA